MRRSLTSPGPFGVGKHVYVGEFFDQDANRGNLAFEGRVTEVVSESTFEGWLGEYLHGQLDSRKPSTYIVDSLVNWHGG